jgi:hypothetical protein
MGRVYLYHHYVTKNLLAFSHSPDLPFLITTVCFRCELDDSVERNLYVRQIGLRKIVEVGIAMTSKVTRHSSITKQNLAARTDIGE